VQHRLEVRAAEVLSSRVTVWCSSMRPSLACARSSSMKANSSLRRAL
jgi:hypothetical protein